MSVDTKSESFLNYITGSAGDWPNLSNSGILCNVDYLVETGSNNIYFNEMNTAISIFGSNAEQSAIYDKISDHANTQGHTIAFIYGQDDSEKINPNVSQQSLISESFARHNISCSFEFSQDTSLSYFSQRGNANYSGSFHLWVQTPYFSDDNLKSIVSGSFNTNTFRSLLNSSPESSSLIPLFDSSSVSANTNAPDFIIKSPAGDGGLINNYKLYDWNGSNSVVVNAVQSASVNGDIVENFIVMSGSSQNLRVNKIVYLMTPTGQIKLTDLEKAPAPYVSDGNDKYTIKGYGRTSASGSLINMYDGTTKQVQDVEVGDIVKSFWPDGMTLNDIDYRDYTTTELTGSFSGSIVMGIYTSSKQEYYLVNGDKILSKDDIISTESDYFVKTSGTWSWKRPRDINVGDYLLQEDNTELEVTSISEETGTKTFYSLDVEDIDTYFQSDILVHNIPGK